MWLSGGQNISRNDFTLHLQPYDFSLEWNGLLLAYLAGSWIIMSSALIGRFTVLLDVELCSDWPFHSAAWCWALLWLAVSQCCLMLSSALIGRFTALLDVELCSDWRFTALLDVELCSDWPFHSAAWCWALLWLAVSQRCLMLSSAPIGCFTTLLNVELCSDWLFHSAA